MKKLKISILYVLLACFFAACTTETPTPTPVVVAKTPLQLLRAKQWSLVSASNGSTAIAVGTDLYKVLPNKVVFNVDDTYKFETITSSSNGSYTFTNNTITLSNFVSNWNVISLTATDLKIYFIVVTQSSTNILYLNYK